MDSNDREEIIIKINLLKIHADNDLNLPDNLDDMTTAELKSKYARCLAKIMIKNKRSKVEDNIQLMGQPMTGLDDIFLEIDKRIYIFSLDEIKARKIPIEKLITSEKLYNVLGLQPYNNNKSMINLYPKDVLNIIHVAYKYLLEEMHKDKISTLEDLYKSDMYIKYHRDSKLLAKYITLSSVSENNEIANFRRYATIKEDPRSKLFHNFATDENMVKLRGLYEKIYLNMTG